MFKIELGAKVADCVTGFKGIVTARSDYLTGCNRYLVEASSLDGKLSEGRWFDENCLLCNSVAELRGTLAEAPPSHRGGPQHFTAPMR